MSGLGDAGGDDEFFIDDVPEVVRSSQEMKRPKVTPPADEASGRIKRKRTKRGGSGKRKGSRASEKRKKPPDVDGTNTALNNARERPSTERLNLAAGVLSCTQGPEQGLALSLIEGNYTIGRGKDNNFVLKDPAASRKHVLVVVRNNRVAIEDLQSGNGTRVNGETITKHVLKDGDRIELGDSELFFTFVGNDRSVEASAVMTDPADRIAKAAEELAAELSDKLRERYEDNTDRENDSAASFLAEQADLVDDVLSNTSDRQQNAPQPADIWQETATRLPLSDVVATDQRLRGGQRPQGYQPDYAPQTPAQGISQEAALASAGYQEPYVESYPYVNNGQRSGGGATIWVLALVTVLVVAAVVVGGWWLLRADNGVDVFSHQMEVANQAFAAEQYKESEAALIVALEAKPDDVAAKALLEATRAKLKASVPKDAPTPPKGEPKKSEPVKAKANVEPDKPEPKPEPEKAKVEPTPVVKPKPKPKPRPVSRTRPKAKPKPRPRPRPKSRAMSDDKALETYRTAMYKIRQDSASERKQGCALVRKVANGAPANSLWKVKAKNALKKYDCE